MKPTEMTGRERFLATMEYQPVDRVPNHEAGVWEQTIDRWEAEGLNRYSLTWDWFTGCEAFEMDAREFIPLRLGMMPGYDEEVLEETERYVIYRHTNGIVTKALKEGTTRGMRSTMDQYLDFPVKDADDFAQLKRRYDPCLPGRLPPMWKQIHLPRWKARQHVLVLGQNCSTLGFYWRAREWMGTENLSYGWYDQPALMHAMMAFIADYTIEVSRPILEEVAPDYIFINEDMAAKGGPLLSPRSYKTFIFPHMKRLVDFYKSRGVRYVLVDTDGNSEPLLPLLMDAGVDGIWPLERASDMDPLAIRKKYGKSLRLWGGVDKRELAKDHQAIDDHLRELAPLVEEGGFIPTVDHTVPPDVSLDNFRYYVRRKLDLLSGRF
jgi:uroporphyrinogen-III decarboxylase